MGKVIELYLCSLCGVTNETCRHWGPVCKRTGERVCADCCCRCEYHRSWSGIWTCIYVDPETRKQDVLKRSNARFNEEVERISAAYIRKKKAEARERAIKAAKAKKRAGGRY